MKLASHWFTGGNDDKILALLREFESAPSHEEFAAYLSQSIEEWSHTFPEALPSAGEWFKKRIRDTDGSETRLPVSADVKTSKQPPTFDCTRIILARIILTWSFH